MRGESEGVNPTFPIYVISKGRWESRLTSKSLEAINVPYRIVIEPQEFDQYSAVIDKSKILVLPFSNLGLGSIPARNWVWEHSISEGHKKHWILDDNIRGFYRLHQNFKFTMTDGTGFHVIEDYCTRYKNLALAGMEYQYLAPRKTAWKPIRFNSRIYSCILIRNDIPYRWRGRYNEDTDLSIRVLRDGWCTVLFVSFLCGKITTLTMKGGNMEQLYQGDGRLKMAQSLFMQHPDICTIVRKWGRWQHNVDYSKFRGNKLIRDESVKIPKGNNNYGMELINEDKLSK